MNTLTNETVQAWIEDTKDYPSNTLGKRIADLGAALLEARRDLADIAKGLQEASKNLDKLVSLNQ